MTFGVNVAIDASRADGARKARTHDANKGGTIISVYMLGDST